MNIFVVDRDPRRAARALCDRHVVKMLLESAQLLCSPFPKGFAPYKPTHMNHRCAVWLRVSRSNYVWLLRHAEELCEEYTRRYGKVHSSQSVIQWADNHVHDVRYEQAWPRLTPFAQAMPDQYKNRDAVKAYRAFYNGEKASFATWKLPSQPPTWWNP